MTLEPMKIVGTYHRKKAYVRAMSEDIPLKIWLYLYVRILKLPLTLPSGNDCYIAIGNGHRIVSFRRKKTRDLSKLC